MMRGLLTILALTPSLGKIIWQPSDIQERQRRLALNLVNSVNDTADPKCIIGGYDDENAARIYVGGPCSKFDYTAGTPSTGFRWVEMETLDLTIPAIEADGSGLTTSNPAGWPLLHSKDEASHAEVGLCSLFRFEDPTISEAGFFASTTSYLAKENINFNKNTFVVDKDNAGKYETIDVCIEKCCQSVPANGCKCSTCPNTNISVAPGDFKYSILAAAFDTVASSTKGWLKCLDKYGTSVAGTTGATKELQAHMMVYQAIDFTNMNADTITVTGTDDSSATYASMQACSLSYMANCTAKSVKSMTIAADGWEGVTYTFPQYFNRGRWATYGSDGAYGATTIDTKPVVIETVRVDDASLKVVGMQGKKVFFVRYKFDITGVIANDKYGSYFVYDPTVNTVTAAMVKSSSGGGTQTGAIAKGARTSTGLTLLAALMVVLNVLK